MFGPIGAQELIVIAAICLFLFGPRRLPALGRSMGEAIRSFRDVGKEIAGEDDADPSADRG